MSKNSSKVSNKNKQGMLFWPKFTQKWILMSKFRKSNPGFGINSFKIPCASMFRQNVQFYFFWPKFALKWILWSEFWKSKSIFGISFSKIRYVSIFRQNRQLWIFWSKFGEIAQLRAEFWFLWCSGFCRELCKGWNELDGSGWSWEEVAGRFSNAH